MNNRFTFGLLTYNQEREVITTLNSIKFQVEQYGSKYNCSLIITDDCSKDNTVLVCKKWLEENRGLFFDVEIKTNVANVGTVKNYNYILSKIVNHPFKILAGDDLISRNNIFETADTLGSHTLFCGFKLMFRGSELVIDEDAIFRQFYLSRINRNVDKNLALFKLGFTISTPQTLYSKELYDISHASEFNNNFRLFEDNPTWYCMLKNVKDIDVEYAEYPIVIYRLSEKSVSNSTQKVNTIFQTELMKLYDTYISEGTIFDKVYFGSIKRGVPNWLNFSKYINKIFQLKCKLYANLHKKEYRVYRDNLNKIFVLEEAYLKRLIEKEGLSR